MSESPRLKPVRWIEPTQKALQQCPAAVRQAVGFALFEAQRGKRGLNVKPLKGFGGAGVVEIVENFDGDTWRAVYTVRFAGVIYVLHVFQKKSKTGIKTPQQDIELIRQRLRVAEQDYKIQFEKG